MLVSLCAKSEVEARAETNIVCLCICSKGNFICRTRSVRNRPLWPGCTTIIFLLLMLCGDVETNPGPITASITADLCGTCHKVVKTGGKALGCEYCNTWFHTVCEKYSEVEYEMLKKPQSHWFCKRSQGSPLTLKGGSPPGSELEIGTSPA